MGINKVILVGNLGRKPEVRYTAGGIPVAKFSVATTERFGTDETGARKERTEWHNCVAWRKLAEICAQYLDKGTKVYLEGRIRSNDYVGQDGVKRKSYEIHIDQMEILTPKGVRETGPEEPAYQEFPDTSAGGQAQTQEQPAKTGSAPAPPNDVDLDPDLDLEEDEDFFVD
jgi:single-strand DNA-binding protein